MMGLIQLSEAEVIHIHDLVLNEGELAGLAKDKSLSGALSRVDFRMSYGLINDSYDLAAAYAVVIATGHTFNDANKRTAYRSMIVCLVMNGIRLKVDMKTMGEIIIQVAQGKIDEMELAKWLRKANHC